MKSAVRKIDLSLIILALLYLAQLHLVAGGRLSLKVAAKGSYRRKKTIKV